MAHGCTVMEHGAGVLPQFGARLKVGKAMDSFRIDEIARRLFESVPPAPRTMQKDLETNFRAVLRERLSKLDLVNRDEFDAQAKVLERTRSRLEALEARLATLEGSAAAPSAGKTPGTG
jgi:BMFP domain-containing protein YqiC